MHESTAYSRLCGLGAIVDCQNEHRQDQGPAQSDNSARVLGVFAGRRSFVAALAVPQVSQVNLYEQYTERGLYEA